MYKFELKLDLRSEGKFSSYPSPKFSSYPEQNRVCYGAGMGLAHARGECRCTRRWYLIGKTPVLLYEVEHYVAFAEEWKDLSREHGVEDIEGLAASTEQLAQGIREGKVESYY